jgi:hypothetical protein
VQTRAAGISASLSHSCGSRLQEAVRRSRAAWSNSSAFLLVSLCVHR